MQSINNRYINLILVMAFLSLQGCYDQSDPKPNGLNSRNPKTTAYNSLELLENENTYRVGGIHSTSQVIEFKPKFSDSVICVAVVNGIDVQSLSCVEQLKEQ